MMAVIFGFQKEDETEDMISPVHNVQPCLHCQAPTTESDNLCCSGCRFLHKGGWQNQTPLISDSPYDHSNVRELYNLSDDPEHPLYRLSVQGLQCSSCVHVIEDLPLFLDTVTLARVNFSAGEMHIQTTREHSLGVILKFLEDMGYPSQLLRADDNSNSESVKDDRALLLRMAIAGACAGNIMLFAVAIYGGLVGTTAFIFNGISLVLFLPVLLYSAQPFHKGAWNALRLGYITVDVPLVAALWLGFLASIYNWWRGSGHVYFDSTAGFFFFILMSRWFLRVSQRKWGQGFFSHYNLNSGFYTVERLYGLEKVPASHIVEGDILIVPRDARIPVDGVLLSPSATVDTAWMTGEAIPKILQSPMSVTAGFKVLSEDIRIRALCKASEGELAKSLRRVEAHSLRDSSRTGIFDKAAQWLLMGVLAIAVILCVLGPLFFGLSFDSSFERALSLLVVACPCALAFGGPLAYGMGLRKASENGIILKTADVLDRVLQIKNIAFDKTGTLTRGELEIIKQTPSSIPDWMKGIILTLEKHSHHPVAYAFRAAWGEDHLGAPLQDVMEIPGKKVLGVQNGRLYSVQSATSSSGALAISFTQDDNVIATFEFEDVLRPEAHIMLRKLESDFSLSILSGDRQDRVNNLARTVGAQFKDAKGGLSPKDKAHWIINNPNTLILGDGVNDAEALSHAHVGIAVQGPLAQGLKFGSVYFMKPGLNSLSDLFEIAKKTRALVRRNLLFALFYNLAAGLAAILGFVDPLVAAALMPLSSLLILFSTWRASR